MKCQSIDTGTALHSLQVQKNKEIKKLGEDPLGDEQKVTGVISDAGFRVCRSSHIKVIVTSIYLFFNPAH